MKYKVGDKVKLKNRAYINIEDTGTIIGITKKFYLVDCIYNANASCPNAHHTLSFSEEEIENYA